MRGADAVQFALCVDFQSTCLEGLCDGTGLNIIRDIGRTGILPEAPPVRFVCFVFFVCFILFEGLS